MKMKLALWLSISALLPFSVHSGHASPGPSGRVLFVSKTSANAYRTIGAAVAAAGPGDAIQITDSSIYYESVVVPPNLIQELSAKPGEIPYMSGEALSGTASVLTVSGPIRVSGIGIYVGGAQYGIQTSSDDVSIDNVSFDVHAPPRGPNWTFGVFAGTSTTITNSNFLGPDTALQTSGGILSNSALPLHITVRDSDFWGIGTAGGAIGVGLPTGSTLESTGNVFGQATTAPATIAMNSWGATTLVEARNAFRNVNVPLGGGFATHPIDATDKKTFGGVDPAAVPYVALTVSNTADSLTAFLGCPAATSFPYPGSTALNHLLDRVVISHYFGEDSYFPGGPYPALDADLLIAMDEMQPRVWEQFLITWARQFDAATWENVRSRISRVRAEPPLSTTLLGGFLMEAVNSTSIANTPMGASFWRWLAYSFPDAASRPLTAKVVNGRRWQAHWFNADAMSGFGGPNFWGTGTGIPNLQRQEGVLYYAEMARQMIDAGMGVVQFAQPQLTFGQGNWQTPSTKGSDAFRTLARFVKEYGACRGPVTNGNRFVLVGLNEAYRALQVDTTNPTQDIDYAEASAGTDNNGGGLTWPNGLGACPHTGGAFTTIPPANAVIGTKPVTLDFDNNGNALDEISVYAHATPSDRNAWLSCFDQWVTSVGNSYGAHYHLALNGVRDVSGGQQSFAGYPAPPAGTYPVGYLLPFDAYGDIAHTQAMIFAPR